jgi:hypothetical protein
MAHACNPSYSGDRDEEDHDLRLHLRKRKQKQKYHNKGQAEWFKW